MAPGAMGPPEMRRPRLPLDRSTADRLAAGQLDPRDAPPGYAAVAHLLHAAAHRPAALGSERIDDALRGQVVAILTADVLAPADLAATTAPLAAVAAAPPTAWSAPEPRTRRVTTRVATLAAVGVLSASGMAAAATGNLPDPAQDAVSRVAGFVGVDLPEGGGDAVPVGTVDDVADPATDPTTDPTAPPAGDGREQDTAARSGPPSADELPPAAGHGSAVSETARSSFDTGREHGQAVSEQARSKSQGNGNSGNGNGNGNGGSGTSTTTPTTVDQDPDPAGTSQPTGRPETPPGQVGRTDPAGVTPGAGAPSSTPGASHGQAGSHGGGPQGRPGGKPAP